MVVEILKDEDGYLILMENGKRVDSHHNANDREDYLEKVAYMLFRRYGWNCLGKLVSPVDNVEDVEAKLQSKYFTLEGEDATKYVQHLPASLATDINSYIARVTGYRFYKKLYEAGHTEYFSATTAYNHALVLANPDKDEILNILNN